MPPEPALGRAEAEVPRGPLRPGPGGGGGVFQGLPRPPALQPGGGGGGAAAAAAAAGAAEEAAAVQNRPKRIFLCYPPPY